MDNLISILIIYFMMIATIIIFNKFIILPNIKNEEKIDFFTNDNKEIEICLKPRKFENVDIGDFLVTRDKLYRLSFNLKTNEYFLLDMNTSKINKFISKSKKEIMDMCEKDISFIIKSKDMKIMEK